MTISYEWKVDFAIIIGTVSLLLTIVLQLVQHRIRRKRDLLEAYEAVYEDACWILGLPYERKKSHAKQLVYEHEDKELEGYVRGYLDSHWMSRTWGRRRFVPKRYFLPLDRLYYLKRVMDEAAKFENEYWIVRSSLSPLELSPVSWMKDDGVRQRMTKVLEHVGHRLSRFSHRVQEHWHAATYADPEEIREEYEKALRACPNFFEHNPREFKDPYYDLLVCIRREYRGLTTSRTMRARRFVSRWWSRVAYQGRRVKWFFATWWSRARHPIEYLKIRREIDDQARSR